MRKRNMIKLIAGLILVFIVFETIGVDESIIFGAIILIAAFLFFIKKSTKKKSKQSDKLPNLTKTKEEHYSQLGMTDQEITFFRDTMNTVKKQIDQLQENMTSSTKLRAIDLRNDTLRVSKALFKELVKEPKKLHSANHFLYTHLPNLVDLTNKYLEIDAHEIKNKQTYEKLEESAQIIDQLSKLIKKDYEQFVADDLEDLDIEISVAKNSLKRDNKDNSI